MPEGMRLHELALRVLIAAAPGQTVCSERQVFLYGWFGSERWEWPSWRIHALGRIGDYISGDQQLESS